MVSTKACAAFSNAHSHLGLNNVSVTSLLFARFLLKSSKLNPTWKNEYTLKANVKG
jgi:hypothetical protein